VLRINAYAISPTIRKKKPPQLFECSPGGGLMTQTHCRFADQYRTTVKRLEKNIVPDRVRVTFMLDNCQNGMVKVFHKAKRLGPLCPQGFTLMELLVVIAISFGC
jgi:hypothetical protein